MVTAECSFPFNEFYNNIVSYNHVSGRRHLLDLSYQKFIFIYPFLKLKQKNFSLTKFYT